MTPAARFLLTATSVAGSVLICIEFVDRPVATWVHGALFRFRPWFDAGTHLVDPLPIIAGLGGVLGAGLMVSGRRPNKAITLLLTACVAVAVAIVAKDQAKYAFGRFWPETWVDNNPSFIRDGVYGFVWFHGGRGWTSFPSGHMAVISAPATVLGMVMPRFRPLAIACCVIVAVGLLGADYHFVSDLIAGTALGALSGAGVARLVGRPRTIVGAERSAVADQPGAAPTKPTAVPDLPPAYGRG